MWKPGDRISHRDNPELGPGRVVAVEGRTLLVEFPRAGTSLRIAAQSDAIVPSEIVVGTRVITRDGRAPCIVEAIHDDGSCLLSDGRIVPDEFVWPIEATTRLADRLARGDVDPVEAFVLQLEALRLRSLREAGGLGSFLGGRIRLFPHQLHVAERATRSDPVRWLLADEVGLGKTVEACLILNHLVHARRVERVVVVAPETLTVQWLGELWRKYHQVFVLLDGKRLADVARDYGSGTNPLEVHRRVVVALETLIANPRLTDLAVAARVDLLIVDEAHRLRRPPGHPGEPAYRAIAPIAALGRHVLLLTATPLEDDAHGFFRLLQLLRPEELPGELAFEELLGRGGKLPACTSATRRADVGPLLPPRAPRPVELADDDGWRALDRLVENVREKAAPNAAVERIKAERVRRALSSPAALAAVLRPDERPLRSLAREAAAADPRLRWLAAAARSFKEAGEKTLVFVAYRETLEAVRTALSRLAQLRCAVFHEDLSAAQRDIEVAEFRRAGGPSILVSTECGGEGRNFEFCHRVVMFDLPLGPAVVEQRIGRLDRIGRTMPVEIVYFRPPSGLAREVASLHERLGLFSAPLGGLDRELARVEDAMERRAVAGDGAFPEGALDRVVREVEDARSRVLAAAYRELHRDPYDPSLAASILARIPADLDDLTADVVLAAAERLGFHVEPQRGRAAYSIELGATALVDQLPGVPGGSSFVGTFDREEAVAREQLDYFSSGHPLVEGILAHLEESRRGRVCLLEFTGDSEGLGLLAVYVQAGTLRIAAVDATGRPRPDWAEAFARRPLRTRRVRPEAWCRERGWPRFVRRLAEFLPSGEEPEALAAIRVRPADR